MFLILKVSFWPPSIGNFALSCKKSTGVYAINLVGFHGIFRQIKKTAYSVYRNSFKNVSTKTTLHDSTLIYMLCNKIFTFLIFIKLYKPLAERCQHEHYTSGIFVFLISLIPKSNLWPRIWLKFNLTYDWKVRTDV